METSQFSILFIYIYTHIGLLLYFQMQTRSQKMIIVMLHFNLNQLSPTLMFELLFYPS